MTKIPKSCLKKTIQAALCEADIQADTEQVELLTEYLERYLFLQNFYQKPKKKSIFQRQT